MFKNYFVVAWRNLGKSKVYSFINILGLSIGMAVALLIAFWVWDEWNFDRSYENHKSLARVVMNGSYQGQKWTNTVISMPLGNALRNQYGSDFKGVSLVAGYDTRVLMYGETKIAADGPWVEADFPKMFSLKMIYGKQDQLDDPSSIFISASVSKALFGNENPIGKALKVNNELAMKISGVYEDFPDNSSFKGTKVLMPWKNQSNWFNSSDPQSNWNNHCGELYVQVADGADMAKVTEKVKNISVAHIDVVHEELMVYPLSRLHLYGEFKEWKATTGKIQFVWLFAIIGIFVLILACINFMNLSTARSEKRAKEVGIRKAIGSLRSQLIGQFLSESLVVAILSLVLAIVFVQISLPFFNKLAVKSVSIPWSNLSFWAFLLGFTLFTGLISGSYPAFYLSAFKPVRVLKGVFRAGRFASIPRKILVVLQFTVSVSLIIGTIIVYKQIQYAKSRPIGYSRSGLILVGKNTPDLWKNDEAIRQELLRTGAVTSVGETNSLPTDIASNNGGFSWDEKQGDNMINFGTLWVSRDYGKTIGWKITQGRDFSREFASDSAGVVVNEEAVKQMGLKNPIGTVLKYDGPIFAKVPHTIVGVIKDMVMENPYGKPRPVLFFCGEQQGVMVIRLNDKMTTHNSLSKVEAVFKKFNPMSPFDYKFNDENYARQFADEEKVGNLAAFFAILAIFISCLGLFGLASFVAEQKTKEIGIRKVLGASVFNVWKLISKDFLILVVISCMIATPIAWHYLSKWLLNYEYRTPISYWIFVLTGLGALFITILTVSFQAIRAGLNNPIKSLRTE